MAYTYKKFVSDTDTKIKENQRVLTEFTTDTSTVDGSTSALINTIADFGSTSADDAWVGGPTKGNLYNYLAAKFYDGSNILDSGGNAITIAGISILDSSVFSDKVACNSTFDCAGSYTLSASDGSSDPNTCLIINAASVTGSAFLDYGLFVFDLSTNNLGATVTGDASEYVTSYIYFCRAHMDEYNYSLNSTFSTSADAHAGTYRINDDLAGDPRTYITGVGLYNDSGDLLAVAKTNVPRLKNDENETLFRIKVSI
jgi:hypothetical protein